MKKLREERARSLYLGVVTCIIAIILIVDYISGSHGMGAVARFFTWLFSQSWRVLVLLWERMVAYASIIAAGRFMKALTWLTMGIGLGYLLNSRDSKRWYRFRTAMKSHGETVRAWWLTLPFLAKSVIVAALIWVQVYEEFWLLLFPIGFLVPVFVAVWFRLKRFVLNYTFGAWYRKRYGATQSRIVRSIAHQKKGVLHSVVHGMRYVQGFFNAGWRLWRYNPTYRPRGELRGRIILFRACLRGVWHQYLATHTLLGTRTKRAAR